MNPLTFFAVAVVVFALAEYLVLPRLNRRIQSDRSPASIRHHLLRAVVGWLRGTALIVGLSSAAILALVFLVGWWGTGTSAADLGKVITRVQTWQERFSGIGAAIGWVALIAVVIGMALLARNRVRKRLNAAFHRSLTSELSRLQAERRSGHWPEIPPTEEMKRAEEHFQKANYVLAHPELLNEADPKNAQTLRSALEQQRDQARENYHRMDFLRRVEVKLDDDTVKIRRAKTRWQKFQRFWFSEGLVDLLSGAMGVASLASLALLVPSLLSITAPGAARQLEERAIVLGDLRIARSQEEARRDWQAGLSLADAMTPLAKEDEEAIARAATQFESSAVRLPGAQQAISAATRSVLRHNSVRRSILVTDAARRADSVTARAPSADAAEKAMVAQLEKPLPDGPVTQAGREVQAELRKAAATDSGLRNRLRAQVARFQQPASEGKLITAMLDGFVSAVGPEGAPDAKPFVDAMNDFRQRQKDIFLGSLKRDGDIAAAVEKIDGTRLEELLPSKVRERLAPQLTKLGSEFSPDAVAQRFRDTPPSMSARTPDLNNERVISAIERASKGGASGRRVPSADIAAVYEDFFPAHMGDETRSTRTAVQQRLAQRAGFRVDPPPTRIATSGANANFVRARSFTRLRGFSRVGGVLIGRTDHADEKVNYDFVDLQWEKVGSRDYSLTLVARDGTRLKAAPQPAPLLHQALVYAADGRSVAVTMVTAEPLEGLKILAHPAVVDTPLGYRLIEVDRFVDTYARGGSEWSTAAEKTVKGWDLLYKLAWFTRFIAVYDGASAETRERHEATPQYREVAEKILQKDDVRAAALQVLRAAAADPRLRLGSREAVLRTLAEQSPLFAKFDFYERSLVVAMVASLTTADLDEFLRTAASRGGTDEESALSKFPPNYQDWSGVRERSGTVIDLFRTPDQVAVSFILQTSFVTPPQYGAAARDENYDDTVPWEYPAIAARIHSATLAGVNRVRKDAAILADVNRFVLVQRLFRAALDGRLGPDFPVGKLTALLEEVIPQASPRLVTPKWNVRGMSPAHRELHSLLKIEEDRAQAAALAKGALPPL